MPLQHLFTAQSMRTPLMQFGLSGRNSAPITHLFLDETPPFLFEPRKRGILAKAAAGKLRIELVSVVSQTTDIAYCITTVSADGCGEIDSMFVEEHFRGCGIGSELVRRALGWLDSVGASSKVVTVAHGNERALAFYKRFGFHPLSILLRQGRANAA
jgi:diamine N-acetyltransferase